MVVLPNVKTVTSQQILQLWHCPVDRLGDVVIWAMRFARAQMC